MTNTDIRILKNIQLTGTMGNCGRMTRKQRTDKLYELMEMGYIGSHVTLTQAGIDVCLHRDYEK